MTQVGAKTSFGYSARKMFGKDHHMVSSPRDDVQTLAGEDLRASQEEAGEFSEQIIRLLKYACMLRTAKGKQFENVLGRLHWMLKTIGADMDIEDEESMDEMYETLRDLILDHSHSKSSRWKMMELLELRANNWENAETISEYYENPANFMMGDVADNNNVMKSPTLPPGSNVVYQPGPHMMYITTQTPPMPLSSTSPRSARITGSSTGYVTFNSPQTSSPESSRMRTRSGGSTSHTSISDGGGSRSRNVSGGSTSRTSVSDGGGSRSRNVSGGSTSRTSISDGGGSRSRNVSGGSTSRTSVSDGGGSRSRNVSGGSTSRIATSDDGSSRSRNVSGGSGGISNYPRRGSGTSSRQPVVEEDVFHDAEESFTVSSKNSSDFTIDSDDSSDDGDDRSPSVEAVTPAKYRLMQINSGKPIKYTRNFLLGCWASPHTKVMPSTLQHTIANSDIAYIIQGPPFEDPIHLIAIHSEPVTKMQAPPVRRTLSLPSESTSEIYQPARVPIQPPMRSLSVSPSISPRNIAYYELPQSIYPVQKMTVPILHSDAWQKMFKAAIRQIDDKQ